MYGTVAGVEALARMWTSDGKFKDNDIYGDGSTNPSLATVIGWLTRISASVDISLANQAFITPVTQPSAKIAIDLLVEQFVRDLCDAANSSGRFFTERSVENGAAPLNIIRREINAWVGDNSTGLELLGVPRIANADGEGEAIFDVI